MLNTLRGLDFFASLHLTIFERPVNIVANRRSNAVQKFAKVGAKLGVRVSRCRCGKVQGYFEG